MSGFKNTKEGLTLKCPMCGSKLNFDPKLGLFKCESCEKTYKEEELYKHTQTFDEKDEFDVELNEYHCPVCGAEVVADKDTATDFCMYCGSSIVFSGRVSGLLKPKYIIPFKIDKQKAIETIKNYLKSYLYVPNSFFKEANLEKISGVYYPFWESDMNTFSTMIAEGTNTTSWTSGDRRYTETKYYDIKREGEIHFEDITVNALTSADKKLVESVLPYPISDHIPFKMTYLSGFHAKKNDLNYQDIATEMNNKMNSYSSTLLRNTIGGYGNVSIKRHNAEIVSEFHDYVMLPIWILNYKYLGKNYTFAINGVTGKTFGKVPLSRGKLAILGTSVAAGIFALIALIGGLI